MAILLDNGTSRTKPIYCSSVLWLLFLLRVECYLEMASKQPVPEHDTPPKDKSSSRNKKHKRNQHLADIIDCRHVCNEIIIVMTTTKVNLEMM